MKTTEKLHIANVTDATHWFEVLQTSGQSQTAIMKLAPGQSSGDEAEAHDQSEQILLVVEGEVCGEIGSEHKTLKKGDVVIIPAGVKHRFSNRSDNPVLTFNVYCPPEYPPDTAG